MNTVGNERGERKSREDKLFAVAEQQAGYFTTRQAQQAGYSYRLYHHHRKMGNWIAVEHGLYTLRYYPDVEDEELVKLSLWSRDRNGNIRAVVSHETALRLHELTDLMPNRIHLSVPGGFRKQPPEGVVLHKARLEQQDVEDRRGYQITTPLRTILDIARSTRVSPEHLEAAVVKALERGMVRRACLKVAIRTLKDKGRRELVKQLVFDDAPSSDDGGPSPRRDIAVERRSCLSRCALRCPSSSRDFSCKESSGSLRT
jgi:hypothetical protein